MCADNKSVYINWLLDVLSLVLRYQHNTSMPTLVKPLIVN